MKAVRSREESLDELKRRRRAVGAKADSAEKKLNKMSPENKNLSQQTDLLQTLQNEIRGLDSEIMTEESRLSDFKRIETKNWMALKFGGLLELSEKGAVSGFLMIYLARQLTRCTVGRRIWQDDHPTNTIGTNSAWSSSSFLRRTNANAVAP